MERIKNAVWYRVPLVGLVVAIALVSMGVLLGASGVAKEEEQVKAYIMILSGEDSRTVNQTVDGILQNREFLIRQLIPLVDPANAQKYKDDTRSAAAFLLGELRAVQAVPVLSRALAEEPGKKIVLDISRFDSPVWTALVKIGRPSVPAMIENIENSDQEVLWRKSLDVLNHVLGGKRRTLELIAKLQDRAAKDDVKKARIVRAAKWAEQHWVGKEEPLY